MTGLANITKFRQHIEQWLRENPKVIAEKNAASADYGLTIYQQFPAQ